MSKFIVVRVFRQINSFFRRIGFSVRISSFIHSFKGLSTTYICFLGACLSNKSDKYLLYCSIIISTSTHPWSTLNLSRSSANASSFIRRSALTVIFFELDDREPQSRSWQRVTIQKLIESHYPEVDRESISRSWQRVTIQQLMESHYPEVDRESLSRSW